MIAAAEMSEEEMSTTESPDTLQNLCLDYIAREIVSDKDSDDSVVLQKSFERPSDDTFLPSVVADVLIARMSDRRTLCDRTLRLFPSSRSCLRHVVIRRSPVTSTGLRVLRHHRLLSLVVEPDCPKRLTVTDVVCCLGDWTVANLRLLGVAGVNFGGQPNAGV